jgi:hypothetical protein
LLFSEASGRTGRLFVVRWRGKVAEMLFIIIIIIINTKD